MVGVPRSSGCQTCLQRRVKCDTLRPACTPCQKYGVPCPGYAKSMKFMDEGPALKKRYGKPHALNSIDEQIAPALVSKSMTYQQPELFRVFVLTAFPRWFGLNRYRVHVPWTVYVADRLGENPALDGSIYCITSVFLGRSHNDTRLQNSSREVYGKALSAFGGLIRNTNRLALREAISTSILLTMFESYLRTDQNAWARHASGAALLMSMRGAKAHLNGFDRCLYLSFRSFLVAEALIHNKPCLFESPEWQDLIDEIRRQDMVDRRATAQISAVINVSDRMFMEVVKIPGLISHVRRLCESSSRADWPQMRSLEMRIYSSHEAIRTLTSELQMSIAAQKPQARGQQSPFIGPMPETFPQEFANGLIRGAHVCFRLLGLLQHNLSVISQETQTLFTDHHSSPLSGSSLPSSPGSPESRATSLPSKVIPFHLVSRLQPDKSDHSYQSQGERLAPVDKWLDLVASSMGMEAVEIVLDNTVQAAAAHAGSQPQGTILPLR